MQQWHRDADAATKPSVAIYSELQFAYDFFNVELFNRQLPQCVITLQRDKRSYGFFANDRFRRKDGLTTDEIALNPDHMSERSDIDVLSTLVHEMCHQWQQHLGEPSRRCYHDREWAKRMREVGLHPSDTGQPGGKQTGQRMSHYIMHPGPFALACERLLAQGFTLSWGSLPRQAQPKEGKSGKRWKFVCPDCGQSVRGKEDTEVMCGKCKKDMEAEEK